jgi:hypothetical protein
MLDERRGPPHQVTLNVCLGAAFAGGALVLLGVNPIVTFEKQLLNMIGKLV